MYCFYSYRFGLAIRILLFAVSSNSAVYDCCVLHKARIDLFMSKFLHEQAALRLMVRNKN